MGYIGFAMSERAFGAYKSGMKPLSKIKKADFAGDARLESLSIDILKNMMKEMGPSEWHHTSCKYNKTDFYSPKEMMMLDDEEIETLKEKALRLERCFYRIFASPMPIDGAWRAKIVYVKEKDQDKIKKLMKQEKKEIFFQRFFAVEEAKMFFEGYVNKQKITKIIYEG